MKTVLYRSQSRGKADHGWLNSYHTFSFANYYDPERMGFGALRVLNDDTVLGGMGFGSHPHRDMEIVSIPLEGALEHKDSMGTTSVIKKGEIQVMSAGTGIMHSEYNKNAGEPVKFLQIWIIPNQMGVKPRYDQIRIDEHPSKNEFQQILSPSPEDPGVWIHQDAWFFLADFSAGTKKSYKIRKPGNGVFVFVLSGQVRIGDEVLDSRDSLGIHEVDSFELEATADSEVLLIEVPMQF